MMLFAVALVVLTASGAPGVQASQARDTRTWYQLYADGKRAAEKGDWPTAIANLESARRLNPKPGRNVPTYGDNFENYNPDYYLGLAYLNTKRFAEADAAFQRVQQANLVTAKDKEYRTFTTEARRASFENLMTSAEQDLAAGRLDTAQRSVAQAKTQATGKDLSRVDTLVGRIQEADLAARQLSAKNAAASKSTPPANMPPATPNDPGINPPAIDSTKQAAIDPKTTNAPPIANVPPQRNAPGKSIAPQGVDTKGVVAQPVNTQGSTPPLNYVEAGVIRMFFSGEYEAAAVTSSNYFGTVAATPLLRFYHACSNAALVLTGRSDRSALDGARAEYARVSNTAQVAAARPFISPRILQLLESK